MTLAEIIAEIPKLTPEEKLKISEALSANVATVAGDTRQGGLLEEAAAEYGRRKSDRRGAVMPVPTLYLDTSVIGGYFDAEWQEPTRELWRQMEMGLFGFVTSVITSHELHRGARQEILDLFEHTFHPGMILDVSDDAKALARAYLRHGVLTEKSIDDATHVAVCTMARIKYLVSWNFKHLVNEQRRDAFNGVNLLQGRQLVRIVSPRELIYDTEGT